VVYFIVLLCGLVSLHSLRVPERIQCKLAVLAYKVLRGDAPRYVVTVISPRSADPRRRLAWSTNTPLGWRRGVVVSGVRQ